MVAPTPTPPNLPTNTPAWDSWLVKVLLIAVPTIFAIWKPDHTFNSASAQALIVGLGIAAAGLVHLVDVISQNLSKYGFTKLALDNAFYQEDSWVHANMDDLKGAAATLKTLPDVGKAVTDVQSRVTDVENKLQAIPAVDQVAIEAMIKKEIAALLGTPPTTVANVANTNTKVTPPAS
jgi:hypothetical protein